jgi:hypothetical protein
VLRQERDVASIFDVRFAPMRAMKDQRITRCDEFWPVKNAVSCVSM